MSEELNVFGIIQQTIDKSQRWLRPWLPRRKQRANKVEYQGRLGDRLNSSEPAGKDDYEKGLIEGVRQTVSYDDSVVVVGGGYGVTAKQSNDICGDVTVFEPSEYYFQRCAEMVGEEKVVKQGFYEDISVWGEDSQCSLTASELPRCDVLVLDCEGVEKRLLEGMRVNSWLPTCVVVETHAFLGVELSSVLEVLSSLGYDSKVLYCQSNENGVYVVRAS